jgi:HD-GYP domain-containing protein (c-di-GMP phosphodiesterase class II)
MDLRTKIITVIAIILMVSIGISTTVALNLQSKRMISSKLADIEVLSNIIMRSIENSMSKGNTEEVQKSLENIGKNPEIVNLRIISTDGYILKSKDPDEIGLKSDDSTYFKGAGVKTTPIVQENSITHMTPILNKDKCYGCHSSGIEINGLIEINYDVSRRNADIIAIKRFLILSNILTVLIIVGILGIMFTRLIITPLKGFLDAIRTVEGGDWDARVKVTGNDELSEIGNAFNKMIEEIRSLYSKGLKKEKDFSRVKLELDHKKMLEELNAQLQYKVQEVEAANSAVLSLSKEVKHKNIELETMVERLKRINEVGRILTSIIETNELIKFIIKMTAELLNVRKGSIHMRRGEHSSLTFQYQHGEGVNREMEIPEGHSAIYSELIEEGRSILLNSGGKNDSVAAHVSSAVAVPLKMKGQIIGGMLLEEKMDGTRFISDELELLGTMANQAMVAVENAWLYETVKTNYFGTIQSLVNALEASDRYTKGHSERVKILGLELAKNIGFDYRELEMFEHAAILHDIGKIGIDTSVLNKQTKLSNSEFSLIKAHPIIGDEILGPIGTLQGVRTTILQHHERYDGSGYPYGIAGDEISLKARLLTVVDTFDAMLTDRPYRKALSINDTLEELKRASGTQFDPVVVNAFIDLLETDRTLLARAGYVID